MSAHNPSTVTSKDGTVIAFDKTGSGPAVILVSGATMARMAWTELAKLLSPHFTVYAYDRRGRGDSTDTQPFALEREIEDIEALIEVAGGSAYVYGISSGGALALEAAARLGRKVKKLALYEVPYDNDPKAKAQWRQYRQNLDKAVTEGRNGDAVKLFMELVGVPPQAINGMEQSPMWAGLEKVAPTLPYDAAAMGPDREPPLERAAMVVAPTLVMDGEASIQFIPFMNATAEALTKAIPHAQHKTLPSQGHDVDSGVLAPVLIEFFAAQ